MTDDEQEVLALREMHASARRNIAHAVRRARDGEGVEGGRRLSRSEDVDVEMWHDEVDDFEIVNAVDHRADACRRLADTRRADQVSERGASLEPLTRQRRTDGADMLDGPSRKAP